MSTTEESLGQLALQSEPSPSVSIKIECPITATVKEDLVTLRTGKSALERKLTEGRDLEAALTIKCGKDAALTSKLAEVTMAMSRLDQLLAELRAILAEGEACDEGVDVTAYSEKLKRHVELVDAHNDGVKMMYKRIRPLL